MIKIILALSLIVSCSIGSEITDAMVNNPIIVSNDAAATRCEEFPGLLFVESLRGCKFYFFCTEEKSGEAMCPIVNGTQLYFHQESQSCQRPEDSKCGLDDQWRGLECPEFGYAKIPHPYQCSKYTVCYDGMQQDRRCPEGLEFSAFEQDCIEPEFSNCFVESDLCGETPFFHQTYFLSSRNCSEFYMCFLHILSHWHCPQDEIFHLDTETCGADTVPACEPSNPTDDFFPEIPDQRSIDCSEQRHEARIPHPETPHFWFFCHHGQSSLIPCYRDQIFVNGTCRPNEV